MAQPRPPNQGGPPTMDDQRFSESFKQSLRRALGPERPSRPHLQPKNLTCCGDCFGMFLPSEGKGDHPEGQCFVVSQVCAERGISTSEDFAKALWVEALKTLQQARPDPHSPAWLPSTRNCPRQLSQEET
jgi:hypothetical protein